MSDSAFPHMTLGIDERYALTLSSGGLTKRELFAAMAMQGLLACPMSQDGLAALEAIEREKGNKEILRLTANSAVKYADALLAELEKERP